MNLYKKALVLGVGSLMLLSGNTAFASCCVYSSTETGSVVAITQQQSVTITRTETSQVVRSISNRIATAAKSVFRPKSQASKKVASLGMDQEQGLAAGDQGNKFGAWSNAQFTRNIQKDNQSNNTATAPVESRTKMDMQLFGADMKINQALMVGITFGHDAAASTTNDANKIDLDTFTTAPYLAYKINDMIGLDALVGFSTTDDGFNTTSNENTRKMGAIGVNGYFANGPMLFTSRLGYMVSQSTNKGTKVKTDFDQVTLVGEASYGLTDLGIPMVEPFVGVGVEKDTRHESAGLGYDSMGGLINVGSRFQFNDAPLTGEVKFESIEGRQNMSEYSWLGNLRYEF